MYMLFYTENKFQFHLLNKVDEHFKLYKCLSAKCLSVKYLSAKCPSTEYEAVAIIRQQVATI